MELVDVSIRRGRATILERVNLRLATPGHVVVSGANGSGKTTLLRVLSGLVPPTGGVISGLPPAVSYLPARISPPTLMRAADYLDQVGRIAGAANSRARAVELLEQLEIRPGPQARIGQLSTGNLQKLAIAQAFIAAADLIVLDEPRRGLDVAGRASLDDLIVGRVGAGTLVVTAEHDQQVGAATRVLTVADGTVRDHNEIGRESGVGTEERIGDSGRPRNRVRIRAARVDDDPDRIHLEPPATLLFYSGRRLEVETTVGEHDGLLTRLISAGWSIEEVGRSDD